MFDKLHCKENVQYIITHRKACTGLQSTAVWVLSIYTRPILIGHVRYRRTARHVVRLRQAYKIADGITVQTSFEIFRFLQEHTDVSIFLVRVQLIYLAWTLLQEC